MSFSNSRAGRTCLDPTNEMFPRLKRKQREKMTEDMNWPGRDDCAYR